MKLHLRVYRETVCHFESEGRLGRARVLRHGSHHLQSHYTTVGENMDCEPSRYGISVVHYC
jgi:hypothetical protein